MSLVQMKCAVCFWRNLGRHICFFLSESSRAREAFETEDLFLENSRLPETPSIWISTDLNTIDEGEASNKNSRENSFLFNSIMKIPFMTLIVFLPIWLQSTKIFNLAAQHEDIQSLRKFISTWKN